MILHHREFGNGQPLIILHGLFGSSDNWLTLAKKLAEDYQVILADLRNHGQSFHDPVFNYQVMSEDVFNLVKHLGLEQFHLLGHSMGGKVAMEFSKHHGEYLDRLVVADIGPKNYPPHHQKILQGLNTIDLEKLSNRTEADQILSQYVDIPAARQFLLKNLGRNQEGGFKWKMNLPVITENINNVGEAQSAFSSYEKPVQFIRGQVSDYILDQDIPHIKNMFPQSKVYTIKNAGHWLHVDNPADFYFTLVSFLMEKTQNV